MRVNPFNLLMFANFTSSKVCCLYTEQGSGLVKGKMCQKRRIVATKPFARNTCLCWPVEGDVSRGNTFFLVGGGGGEGYVTLNIRLRAE